MCKTEDLRILRPYGLEYLSSDEIISRVSYDLTRPDSRIQDLGDVLLQSAFIEFLLTILEKATEPLKQSIQSLKMFKTRSGEWVSCSDRTIYFSIIEGTTLRIPTGVYTHVLQSKENGLYTL